MFRFWPRLLLLAYQVVWLTVVIPGHQRGAIAVAGSERSCCESKAEPPTCHVGGAGKGKADHGDPAARWAKCAVCSLALRITTPPAIDLTPPPLRLLEVLPPEVATDRPELLVSPTYEARGPPAA